MLRRINRGAYINYDFKKDKQFLTEIIIFLISAQICFPFSFGYSVLYLPKIMA